MCVWFEGLRQRLKQGDERFLQRSLELCRVGKPIAFDLSAQLLKQPRGRIYASIRSEQYGFQFLVERFVYLAAAEQAGYVPAQVIPGPRKAWSHPCGPIRRAWSPQSALFLDLKKLGILVGCHISRNPRLDIALQNFILEFYSVYPDLG